VYECPVTDDCCDYNKDLINKIALIMLSKKKENGMSKNLPVLIILTLGLFIGYCSQSNDADPVNGSELLSTLQVDPQDGDKVCGERDDYSLIVMDSDRWEIRLNQVRERRTAISYSGHLWYRSGRRIFEGTCTAVWSMNGILNINAVDARDDGHISYSFEFYRDEGVDLVGSFAFLDNPRSANYFTGWLEKGQLGGREGREEAPPMEMSQGTGLKSNKMSQD